MREHVNTADSSLLHGREVQRGERFQFGSNWASFLRRLDEERIKVAEQSLTEFLAPTTLKDKDFLDIGSGSGLFSLAARRLGARVASFDYDPQSVACTKELRRRYFPDNSSWSVAQGSALDREYLAGLGQFDIVYSWGVLHHTGAMWRALANAKPLVKPGGLLFIAIYNDFGKLSRIWLKRKRRYNAMPRLLRPIYAIGTWLPGELRLAASYIWSRRFREYLEELWHYRSRRGMSRFHDVLDWIGGYPYEYARASELVEFYAADGFIVRKLVESRSVGCHQIVFQKA